MTHVGIIEAGRPSNKILTRHGSYGDMFIRYFAGEPDLKFSSLPLYDKQHPVPSVNDYDAYLTTGSSHSVYENHSWIADIENLIREAAAKGTPHLGICFGHQIHAQALGGKVAKSSGPRGIGVHRYNLTETGKEIFGPAFAFNLNAAHQDQVLELPEGAVLLATSRFCENAAIAYGRHGLSLQGHPEATRKIEYDTIEGWQKRSPTLRSIRDTAIETLKMPLDAHRLKRTLANFLAGQPNF